MCQSFQHSNFKKIPARLHTNICTRACDEKLHAPIGHTHVNSAVVRLKEVERCIKSVKSYWVFDGRPCVFFIVFFFLLLFFLVYHLHIRSLGTLRWFFLFLPSSRLQLLPAS